MLVNILVLLVILLGWGLYRDLIIEYYDYFLKGQLKDYGEELLGTWCKFVKGTVNFTMTLIYFPIMWLLLIPAVVIQDLIHRYRK